MLSGPLRLGVIGSLLLSVHFCEESFAASESFRRSYDEAQTRIQNVLRRFPNSAVAWFLRGHIREQRGEYKQALQACRKAAEI